MVIMKYFLVYDCLADFLVRLFGRFSADVVAPLPLELRLTAQRQPRSLDLFSKKRGDANGPEVPPPANYPAQRDSEGGRSAPVTADRLRPRDRQ